MPAARVSDASRLSFTVTLIVILRAMPRAPPLQLDPKDAVSPPLALSPNEDVDQPEEKYAVPSGCIDIGRNGEVYNIEETPIGQLGLRFDPRAGHEDVETPEGSCCKLYVILDYNAILHRKAVSRLVRP